MEWRSCWFQCDCISVHFHIPKHFLKITFSWKISYRSDPLFIIFAVCVSLHFISVIKHWRKTNLEEERLFPFILVLILVCFSLRSPMTVHYWWKPRQECKQDRNLEARTETEAPKKCCLQACSSQLDEFVFYTTQNYLPRGGTTCSSLGLSISLIKKTLQKFVYRPIRPQLRIHSHRWPGILRLASVIVVNYNL